MWVSSGVRVNQRMLHFYQGSAKQPRPCLLLGKILGGPGDAEVCFQPYVLKICWRRNIKIWQSTLLFSLSGWAGREGSPLLLLLSPHLHPQGLRVQQLLGLPPNVCLPQLLSVKLCFNGVKISCLSLSSQQASAFWLRWAELP